MTDSIMLMALFDEGTATAEAIDSLHELGLPDEQIVVMTGVPYPERALGRHVEWLRLPQVVLVGAIGGLIFGLFLAVITPHLYRLDVGGHPTVSFPPAAVITFVFTMMATIISTFLGVLWEMDFPEFDPRYYTKEVADGQLAVLIESPVKIEDQVREILNSKGGRNIHRPEKVLL